ncbi:hypothetical protein [Pseudoalteromonas sp. BSi20429]|uniref:hypothetical protein n=1 Tax=Pseudoalteromonas sp. BSi20429 TaxID=1097676 RepID=UPI0002316C60|nr:hypothetical protein [Pseudoalteromonas sp. BSi20429]GAA66927.1 hypothetical protein P20429_1041 [Pseudoalteromonas sp. BSi20429]
MVELLLNTNISFYIGIFVQWGFLMAFLYSLASSINSADKSIVWLSFIMALSYSSSMFIDMDAITYFDFFLFDIITLFVIILSGFFIKISSVYIYLLFGLGINTSLFFSMYIDNDVMHHYEFWWFWWVYIVGINFTDLTMVLVFFIGKDVLKLAWLEGKLNKVFNKRAY